MKKTFSPFFASLSACNPPVAGNIADRLRQGASHAMAVIMFFSSAAGFCAETGGSSNISGAVKTNVVFESRALTLNECYKLALKQSEYIAIDYEKIREAEAHFLQALGTLLPQVSFSRQDTRNEYSDMNPTYNKSYEQKFTFTQALFTGFKEFAGMAGSRLERKQREYEKLRAEQLLFIDVADAFYLLLVEQEDIEALETIENAFIDRIDELKTREKIGKSRTSEVVMTETQLYTLEDQIESVKSKEQVARELLAFLIGGPVNEIIEPEYDFSLKPESAYQAEAYSRPDVRAAHFAWQADLKGVMAARSGFYPQVNFEGDYYTHRSTTPTDSSWGAMLTIYVPIFEGTITYGQVKQAVAIARESELLFQRARRVAVREIHDAYVYANSDILRVGILEKALKSAEKNYDLQRQDYRLSVVNNLDVLAALQSLEDVRRSFIHVSNERKRFYWQLLVAAGEIDLE